MKNEDKIIYAIYKNGEHKGNQKDKSHSDAIKSYIIDSGFKSFLNDKEFMSQYSAKIAIETVHYFKSKYLK